MDAEKIDTIKGFLSDMGERLHGIDYLAEALERVGLIKVSKELSEIYEGLTDSLSEIRQLIQKEE